MTKMLNDFLNGREGKSMYYDEPDFDGFWKSLQQLDVVIYIHPRFYHPTVIESLIFGGRSALLGTCK